MLTSHVYKLYSLNRNLSFCINVDLYQFLLFIFITQKMNSNLYVTLLILLPCAYGDKLEINDCSAEKPNHPNCTVDVFIPEGGLEGLRVGPEFVVKG